MKTILILLLTVVTFACSVPQMAVNDQLLESGTGMDVRGRQGWVINQKLEFGPYQTDKVSRGWTKSYPIGFLPLGINRTEEKYSFSITNGKNGLFAMCAAKLEGVDIPVDRLIDPSSSSDVFSFIVQSKDLFTSTIVGDDGRQVFHLVVANRDDFRKNSKYIGLLTGNGSEPIMIVPVRNLQGQKTVGLDVVGYEFTQGDSLIGAVETLNKGKVWIDDALEERHQLLLAAVSSALLLQNDLYYHSEDL